MSYDRGRNYNRSLKINGRMVRGYIGSGIVGETAAEGERSEFS